MINRTRCRSCKNITCKLRDRVQGMPLGEEPITSYFPRLPPGKSKQPKSSAKRKSCKVAELPADDQPPKPGPSRKRSRRTTTSSLSSISSATPPPAWDLFNEPRKPKPKKIRREQIINKSSSVISLSDDSDCDLATKDTMKSEPRSSRRTVQMKTCTADGERRLRINPPQPSTSHHDVHNKFVIDLSNSPRRPRRRRSVSSTFSLASAHCDAVHDTDRDTEVLSSQISERPDELFVCSSKDPTHSLQGSSVSVTRPSNVESSIRSSHYMPPPDDPSADYPESHIVESSQTQNILLNYVSPRRPRIHRQFFLHDEENTEQIVQTSQTQSEIDVQARPDSTPRSVYSIFNGRTLIYLTNDRNPDGFISRPLARMLSDVLFSVPRREATFTETDDLAPQPHEQSKGLDENEAIQEESVTESDSDGEMLGFLANYKSFSHREPSVPSLSQCYTDQTQTCSSGTFDDSIGSLPSVVKDFHDMFRGEGSYQAKFPTLR